MVDLLGVAALSILMTIALYLWLGNIWACVAALSFAAALGIWIFKCMNALLTRLQFEMRSGIQNIELKLSELEQTTASGLNEILKAVKP